MVKPGGPHWVAQISNGVEDFTVDVFPYPDLCPPRVLDQVESLRNNCSSAARLVSIFAADHSRRLEEVRTGRLIRVVLHAEGGAIYCYSVVPDQYVVGLRLGQTPDQVPYDIVSTLPEIKLADESIACLINELRQRIGLRTQNPGGFKTQKQSTLSGDLSKPFAMPASDTALHIEGIDSDGSLSTLCQAAVDPADLQLVSVCRGPNLKLSVDYFGHEQVGRFFTLITIDSRRKFYADLALGLPHMLGPFRRLARSTVGGQLLRVTLDVEQGAVYYYRLNSADYLVGVTLDQSQVNVADKKMALLARKCREVVGAAH
jgi:hypothetical protein